MLNDVERCTDCNPIICNVYLNNMCLYYENLEEDDDYYEDDD
jgi:hypothetical protein